MAPGTWAAPLLFLGPRPAPELHQTVQPLGVAIPSTLIDELAVARTSPTAATAAAAAGSAAATSVVVLGCGDRLLLPTSGIAMGTASGECDWQAVVAAAAAQAAVSPAQVEVAAPGAVLGGADALAALRVGVKITALDLWKERCWAVCGGVKSLFVLL